MNINILYLLFYLLLFSCNAQPKPSVEQRLVAVDSTTLQKEYSFFHEKLFILSTVKPYEEDGRNTVSQLSLSVYSDIKKYSFPTLFQKGLITITVAELKEKDTSLSADKLLNEIVAINENMDAFTVHYEKLTSLKNSSFSGYWTTGKLRVKGENSSNMYLNVLTNKKIIITTVAVYDSVNDLDTIHELINSIRKKN